ncbi:MAG TPA: hypothetical protein VGL95_14800 [Acetobacteraceae bacterium]
MTPAEFREALAEVGFSQRGFATYTGSNERSVRRWALGEQDIPHWVPVLLRCEAALLRAGVPAVPPA